MDSCDFLIRIFCQCRDFSKDISISHFELGVLELSAKFLPFLKSARDLRLTFAPAGFSAVAFILLDFRLSYESCFHQRIQF